MSVLSATLPQNSNSAQNLKWRAEYSSYRKAMISLSGKVFLLGEYSVLQGGPALLLSTEGSSGLGFRAEVSPCTSFELNHLSPQSPAGRLLEWAFARHALGLKINWLEGFHAPKLLGLGS